MDGRKTLPVGGKYPDERFIQFALAGRQFGTVVYRDKDPWSIGIEVVEEIRSRKSHGTKALEILLQRSTIPAHVLH